MIFILPIGHERKEVRRLPHVSIAILALNLMVFGATYLAEGDHQLQVAEYHVRTAFEKIEQSPHAQLSPELLDRLVSSEGERRQLKEEVRLLREAKPRPSPETLAQDQREVDDACARALGALESTYFHRLGFVPTKPRVSALFTSMFIHAGWMHLLGNMFFFYLAGPFLEDVFGRPLFAIFYLLSGLAAVALQWLTEPMATSAYGGASGAIAGLMGAFLVRFATTRIRFAYFFFLLWPFRLLFLAVRNAHRLWRGTFWAPAYLMLPLWLVHQFYLVAKLGTEAGVAFWAHIGGFAFGAVVALLLKVTRIEERWIHPAIEAELSYATHPALDKAIDSSAAGRHKQARHYLNIALKATPNDPDVWLELHRNALALGELQTARDAALRNVELEIRAGRNDGAWETYLEAATRWRDLAWPPALLAGLARSRDRVGDEIAAIDTWQRLLFWHPAEPLAARALAQLSTYSLRDGDAGAALELLMRALTVPGLDPMLRTELEERVRDLRVELKLESAAAPAAAPAATPPPAPSSAGAPAPPVQPHKPFH